MLHVLFADKRGDNINIQIYDLSSFDALIDMIKAQLTGNNGNRYEYQQTSSDPLFYVNKCFGYDTGFCFEDSFFESKEYKNWYEKFNKTNKAVYVTEKGYVEINILNIYIKPSTPLSVYSDTEDDLIEQSLKKTALCFETFPNKYANITDSYNKWSKMQK